MKKFLLIVLVAAAAGLGGWFFAKRSTSSPDAKPASGERKVAFYQSPMHPWIKSDKPGNCTICGMKLMPVYEGEKGFGGDTEGVTTLGSNTIQVINVQTDEVKKRPLVRTLRVAGTIDDDDTKHRRLSSYVDGRIDKLFVNFVGAEVVSNQPLATLYSPMLLTAESEYLTVLRQKPFGTTAVLQGEHERLVAAAAERLKRLGYTAAQISALANKKEAEAHVQIVAPVTGTVVMRNVYEGQYVKEGDLLFELADFNQMWFQFDAYERDLVWLRVGQQVDVTSPSLPNAISAPIAFIDPNLNDMTRSARVRVVLENPVIEENGRKRRQLFHRMYADGVVKVEVPEVLAVPRTAVLAGGPQPVAYVDLGGGAYEQRKLKLGRTGDDFVEVLDGLKASERVVTTGNLLIDSQAQLNASASSMPLEGSSMSDTNSVTLESLNDAQKKLTQEFMTLTSDLGGALAADDVKKFNALAPRVHAEVPKLMDALGPVKSLRPALARLEQNGHMEAAKDLAAARKEFLPFSMAAVELAKLLRGTDGFKETKIYNCPMVNRAIPGAAKNGQWIQLAPPLRNPYFGADMLECGNEVKP
jgi:membrane fusion protein, copper/silver efflux system